MNVQKILPTINNMSKTNIYEFPTKNVSLTKASAKYLPTPLIKEIASVFENYVVHISHIEGAMPQARVRIFEQNTSFDNILHHKKALVEVQAQYSHLLGTLQESVKKANFIKTFKKELNNIDESIVNQLPPHELKKAMEISRGYKIGYKPVFVPIQKENSELYISNSYRNNFSDPYLAKGKDIDLQDIQKAIHDFIKVKTPLS